MTMLAVPLPPSREHRGAESRHQALVVETDVSAPDVPVATVYRPSWRALIYGMGAVLWLVALALVWWPSHDVHLGVQMGVTFLPLGAAAIDSARLDTGTEDPEVPSYEAHASATHVVCMRCMEWIPRNAAVIKDGVLCASCDAAIDAEVA